MNKLLNRFSWGISMALGLLIVMSFGRIIGFFGFESFWLAIPIVLLVKRFFLGKDFIEERVTYFADTMREVELKPHSISPTGREVEQKYDKISEEVFENKEKIELIEEVETVKKNPQFKYSAIAEKKIEKAEEVPSIFDIYMKKVGKYIKDFFATNTLAKIGGILIFLAVIYFLKGVVGMFWEVIGPIGRLLIGFAIGMVTFFTGTIMYSRGNKNEGLILVGLSILINYSVILSGRYIIGENMSGGDGFLTEGITFIFLILNTIFGVVTSYVYNSRTLLIFSFIFAYLNPFLIGTTSNGNPYTLVGYSLIVSFGALFLSYKSNNLLLLIGGFVLGNILILLAPVSDDMGWNIKLIASILLGLGAFIINPGGKKTLFIAGGLLGSFALNIGTFPFAYGLSQSQELEHSGTMLFYNAAGFSLFLLFFFYFFSLRKGLEKLYGISSISIVGLLGYVIFNHEMLVSLNILIIVIFALANWILPFINKNLLKNRNNIGNLIIGSLAGVVFIAFQIYSFGEIYFPGIAQGLAFGGLAVIYFIQSYFIAQKIGTLSAGSQSSEDEKSLKNIFYTYAGISLSLFSLAIAFVFSNYPEIISTVWLFEATILFYFSRPHPNPPLTGEGIVSNGKNKILIAGNVLFVIGIFELGLLLDVVHKEDYKFLVSFGIIAASLILNIRFIDKIKNVTASGIHYVLHIIGIGVLATLLFQIIISNGHGWSSFGISTFILILGFFYSLLKTDFLKWFFVFVLGAFAIFHIGGVDYIFYRLRKDDIEYFKVLQYIVTGIIIANYFVWKKFNKPHLTSPSRRGIIQNNFNKIILIIVSIYSFIISNIYILDIFEEIFGHFSLTIYWGLIASVLLFYGIAKDIIKFRTIGLYFIMLTSAKIFLYDVWMLGNTSSRVIAFMGLGILFIAISTFYTKKYGNNIIGELSLDNLKEEQTPTRPHSVSPKRREEAANLGDKIPKVENKSEDSFMEKLENVNIDSVRVVRFSPNKSEKFTIRAKNLMRVSQLVIKQTGKTKFKPKELSGIYNYVVENYKSNLSRREYDKLRTSLKSFIDEGGEVEVVKK